MRLQLSGLINRSKYEKGMGSWFQLICANVQIGVGNIYTGDSKQTFRNWAKHDLTSSQLYPGEIRHKLQKQEMEYKKVHSSKLPHEKPIYIQHVFLLREYLIQFPILKSGHPWKSSRTAPMIQLGICESFTLALGLYVRVPLPRSCSGESIQRERHNCCTPILLWKHENIILLI